MIRLTHSSWMTLSGVSPLVMAETKATTSATKLTVSWNCRARAGGVAGKCGCCKWARTLTSKCVWCLRPAHSSLHAFLRIRGSNSASVVRAQTHRTLQQAHLQELAQVCEHRAAPQHRLDDAVEVCGALQVQQSWVVSSRHVQTAYTI